MRRAGNDLGVMKKSQEMLADTKPALALMQGIGGPDQEEIARQAYAIWEQEGGRDGRDLDYWLEAEKQVLAGSQVPSA